MAKPSVHLVTSLGLGAALFAASRDPRRLLIPLLSGFLLDADHFVDYAVARTPLGRRVVVPLHGWEYVPPLIAADRWLRLGGALAGAYCLHLAIDQVTNPMRTPYTYFLTFRAAHRFRRRSLGNEGPSRGYDWMGGRLRDIARVF